MTVSAAPSLLASTEQLVARQPELTRDLDAAVIQSILEEATQHIEDRTGRRLAPFVGHVYQDTLEGIDPDEYGGNGDLPMSFTGTLGLSQASAYGFGAADLSRHMWLDQFAPVRPELWTYNIQSMQVYRTYGDTQPIDFANGGILGPDVTDGHVWFRMGTFAPIGSRVQVIYDGGYTVSIPPSLRQACILQATKSLILDAEPQNRKDMNLDEIDAQISMLVGPWMRA